MNKQEVKAEIEALLFMATEPLAVQEIKEVLTASKAQIKDVLEQIQQEYSAADKGIELAKVGSGYQLQTKADYRSLVKEFHQPEENTSLTQAALETLAIIAYKQPVTRPEVEAIRGVNVEKALKTLQKRGLVEKKGQKETIGCPKLYGTTDQFLDYMGLSSLEELPTPQEFAAEDISQLEEEVAAREVAS